MSDGNWKLVVVSVSPRGSINDVFACNDFIEAAEKIAELSTPESIAKYFIRPELQEVEADAETANANAADTADAMTDANEQTSNEAASGFTSPNEIVEGGL